MRQPKALRRKRWTVRGTGSFPHDMLRYDMCFPATMEDQLLIEFSDRVRPEFHVEIMIEMYLGPDALAPAWPTVGRWESFGWSVTEIYKPEKIPFSEIPPDRLPLRFRNGKRRAIQSNAAL